MDKRLDAYKTPHPAATGQVDVVGDFKVIAAVVLSQFCAETDGRYAVTGVVLTPQFVDLVKILGTDGVVRLEAEIALGFHEVDNIVAAALDGVHVGGGSFADREAEIVLHQPVSKSHNKANINRTHEQSLEAYKEIRAAYPDLNIVVDLATTFGCPFEGKYNDPQVVVDFLKDYINAGMTICCLCDTIGIADPAQVKNVIGALKAAYPALTLQVHFHDTRGLGMVNTMTAIESGVTEVQSALGGLGGCPFAPGASGNLSTEDMIWMLNEMGCDTGIEFSKVLAAAKYQAANIPGNYSGHHIHIEQETPCKH